MNKRPLIALLAIVSLTFAAGVMAAEGSADAGKQKSTACAACHGPDGNSANGQFPNLAGQHASYIYGQLKAFKSGDRKNAIMNGQAANLSDQDMKDLAAYFSSQTMKIGAANKDLVKKGENIYRGGDASKGLPACIGCHGPAGWGNAPAKFPRIGGQKPTYVVTQLQNYASGDRTTDPNGMMRDIASKLSDDEMKAVASYVSGLYTTAFQSKSESK